MASIKAGSVYFGIVFACAFLIGAVRVLLVAPRLGETTAVLLETPVVLAISWWACRRSMRAFDAPNDLGQTALMGAVAFLLLMAAELCVSVVVFGRGPAAQLRAYQSLPGAIGLMAQVAFALIPAVQGRLYH